MKLLVICACGMSSSALVNKMREYVKEQPDMDYQVGSCATNQISRVAPLADMILIAPQIGYMEDEIKHDFPDKKFYCISEKDYANQNVANIFDGLSSKKDTRSKAVKILNKIAKAIARNKVILAISKGMMSAMPATLMGSLCILLIHFPLTSVADFISSCALYPLIQIINTVTIGCISLYTSYFIAYHYVNSLKADGGIAGINALICALMVFGISENGLDLSYTDGKGMFVSILVGLISGRIYAKLSIKANHSKYDRIPVAIRNQFISIVPMLISVLTFATISSLMNVYLNMSFPEFVYSALQIPVSNFVGNNIVTYLFLQTISGVFWFFGIHGGSIINPVRKALYSPLSIANLSAYQAGLTLPYMIEDNFLYAYTFGGAGSTLALAALMLFKSKSVYMKNLGKISFPMGIFFINEPILFGLPIVLNPIMLIPLFGTTIICGLSTYLATSFGILPYLNGMSIPWTTPIIISGLLLGGVRVALWQIIMFILSLVIWYPFFKIEDQRYCEIEKKK